MSEKELPPGAKATKTGCRTHSQRPPRGACVCTSAPRLGLFRSFSFSSSSSSSSSFFFFCFCFCFFFSGILSLLTEQQQQPLCAVHPHLTLISEEVRTLSLSLSLSHTHTHTDTHARTHAHTRIHSKVLPPLRRQLR